MKNIANIVHHFQELLGIKLYLVGGSVRDLLLGIPHSDLDFATPALPEEIEEAVRKAGLKPLTMGKRFGTIAFKYNPKNHKKRGNDSSSQRGLSEPEEKGGGRVPQQEDEHLLADLLDSKEPIEITTFRTETYGASRKPDVEYVRDITQDLARRDFTINAMAVNDAGKLIDPYSGYADLTAEKIRFVGKPAERINEDPLRMLRGCRLSAQFAFVPTAETKER